MTKQERVDSWRFVIETMRELKDMGARIRVGNAAMRRFGELPKELVKEYCAARKAAEVPQLGLEQQRYEAMRQIRIYLGKYFNAYVLVAAIRMDMPSNKWKSELAFLGSAEVLERLSAAASEKTRAATHEAENRRLNSRISNSSRE